MVFYDQGKDFYGKYLDERLGEEKRQRQREPEPFILFNLIWLRKYFESIYFLWIFLQRTDKNKGLNFE